VAAAATAAVAKRKAKVAKKPKTFDFIANQPFFFLLEHAPSESIIFTAKIYNPAA
jgi:serine protease inhibitor